jgi:GT2 family glycosyltransferase
MADFGCVILTMGKRKEELRAALTSLEAQVDITFEVIIVGNGWNPATEFPHHRCLYLTENLGIPAGRNAGAREIEGEYLFFLDDDVLLFDPKTLSKALQLFKANKRIGLIQPRVLALDGSTKTPKRWIPRLRVGNESKSSVATSLWEGATAINRNLFNRIGGWPENFFYAHEGIDLVWRVLDQGSLPWYAADIEVKHPVINPARHDYYYFLNARNRVWLAKRNLRFPFSFIYPLTWLILTILRFRSIKSLSPWFLGFFNGIFTTSKINGKRLKKLKWRTHFKLTRFGRPPII